MPRRGEGRERGGEGTGEGREEGGGGERGTYSLSLLALQEHSAQL